MKAVIFAGGVGTRLWPLSRQKSPKQFERIIGDKSTMQLAVERLRPDFKYQDIYISTGKMYVNLVRQQLPAIPKDNIVGEPEMRDVGPAVGLMSAILAQEFAREPFAILWSDHLVKQVKLFKRILKVSGEMVAKLKDKIIFIGQNPHYASQNLGWIKYGAKLAERRGIAFYEFISWKYRPAKELAEQFFADKSYYWNTGYFVTTPHFMLGLYRQFVPQMYRKLMQIAEKWGREEFDTVLNKLYPTLTKIHFDNAILEKLDKENAYVIAEDIGWSDVGAWEALKEALQGDSTRNVTKGKVLLTDCEDSLIYNYTDQTVAAIDVNQMLVINTGDVLLVCHKDSVPKIKELVNSLAGTQNEHLT